jgi:hypothetical protein
MRWSSSLRIQDDFSSRVGANGLGGATGGALAQADAISVSDSAMVERVTSR